jgi:hypothetical protein
LRTDAEERAFVSGQWHAYNEVLGYLNTLETVMTDKTEIYKYVFSLRPKQSKEIKK